MRLQSFSLVLLALGLFSHVATAEPQARDVALLSASCAACHGTNGHSQAGMPKLAGMDRHYFVAQMQAFRSGERAATVMHHHAMGYTKTEIDQMATFFANKAD